jgi:Ca2+:H+ antiporter
VLSLVCSLKTHYVYTGDAEVMQAAGETAWSVRHAIGILAGTTLAVAVMSELLVRAIEPAAERLGLTQVFVGVIRVVFSRPLDLILTPFEVTAVTIAVLAVASAASNGESNGLEGVMLLGVNLSLADPGHGVLLPAGLAGLERGLTTYPCQ